jgi:ethanolamine utilization protein EutA
MGGCIHIDLANATAATVKKIGQKLARMLSAQPLTHDRVLVLFVAKNAGKSLGSYATNWGRVPVNLIVIDEIATRSARFASLGAMRDNVVPVSLYGLE